MSFIAATTTTKWLKHLITLNDISVFLFLCSCQLRILFFSHFIIFFLTHWMTQLNVCALLMNSHRPYIFFMIYDFLSLRCCFTFSCVCMHALRVKNMINWQLWGKYFLKRAKFNLHLTFKSFSLQQFSLIYGMHIVCGSR